MFRRLVVPLDGSSLAERALPYAVRLAQSKGRLVLVRAVLAPPPRTLDEYELERDQTQVVEEAEEYLHDMAESVSGQVAVETVVLYGRAAPQILGAVHQFDADGIVMASHGRTGVPHLLYGSVTESVLANCIVPVFVVHARPGEAAAPSFSPYSARILVAQDGSAYDAVALHAALDMVGPQGEIVLMTAAAPPDHVLVGDRGRILAYLDQLDEGRRQAARDHLDILAEELRKRPHAVKVTTDVRIGDPAASITFAALDRGVDLIVMATHGRTGINRAFTGSVAGTVLRTGSTPVLLVHPRGGSSSPPVANDATAIVG